jgi:hypothetical protein
MIPILVVSLFLLLSLGSMWTRKRMAANRFRHTNLVVSTTKPQKMLVSRIEQVRGDQFRYWLNLSTKNAVGSTSKRVKIEWGSPMIIYQSQLETMEFWKGLCTASQLDGISPSGVFPIPCQTYIDPDTQEPVAIVIKDSLVFVVPDETSKTKLP